VSEADSKWDREWRDRIQNKYGMRALHVVGLEKLNDGFKTVKEIEESNTKKAQEGFKVSQSSVTYKDKPLNLSLNIRL
jgi:hypothetical protein